MVDKKDNNENVPQSEKAPEQLAEQAKLDQKKLREALENNNVSIFNDYRVNCEKNDPTYRPILIGFEFDGDDYFDVGEKKYLRVLEGERKEENVDYLHITGKLNLDGAIANSIKISRVTFEELSFNNADFSSLQNIDSGSDGKLNDYTSIFTDVTIKSGSGISANFTGTRTDGLNLGGSVKDENGNIKELDLRYSYWQDIEKEGELKVVGNNVNLKDAYYGATREGVIGIEYGGYKEEDYSKLTDKDLKTVESFKKKLIEDRKENGEDVTSKTAEKDIKEEAASATKNNTDYLLDNSKFIQYTDLSFIKELCLDNGIEIVYRPAEVSDEELKEKQANEKKRLEEADKNRKTYSEQPSDDLTASTSDTINISSSKSDINNEKKADEVHLDVSLRAINKKSVTEDVIEDSLTPYVIDRIVNTTIPPQDLKLAKSMVKELNLSSDEIYVSPDAAGGDKKPKETPGGGASKSACGEYEDGTKIAQHLRRGG